jgi:hypothetical protein
MFLSNVIDKKDSDFGDMFGYFYEHKKKIIVTTADVYKLPPCHLASFNESSSNTAVDEPVVVEPMVEPMVEPVVESVIETVDEPVEDMEDDPDVVTCQVIDKPKAHESYFGNNRQMFQNEWHKRYSDNHSHESDITCERLQSETFAMLPHQIMANTYMSVATPYRGLLVYHGLGSGKTCTAISIAEGLKPYMDVVVLTPSSLQMNFKKELAKCATASYSYEHDHWAYEENPAADMLATWCVAGAHGLWVRTKTGVSYKQIPPHQQTEIRSQIQDMVDHKYSFINYNGLRASTFQKKYPTNPFDNKCVIVDEAHNLVLRIVNADKSSTNPSILLYHYLLSATNCRLVMLTGTPIINSVFEIAVMYNMLRGEMKTYEVDSIKLTDEELKKALPDVDSIYKVNQKTIVTQAPQGFTLMKDSKLRHDQIVESVPFGDRVQLLYDEKVTTSVHYALPDKEDDFNAMFVEDKVIKNKLLFKTRIMGLTSYFPSLERLMPTLKPPILHKCIMSTFQLKKYREARLLETERKKDVHGNDISAGYRIRSRLVSNTAYPESLQKWRDNPENEVLEVTNSDSFFTQLLNTDYVDSIQQYSPKYVEMCAEIMKYPNDKHLVYSQFLNIEGIKLFSLILEANAYTHYQDGQDGFQYIVYGGKTDTATKEMYRTVFNENTVPTCNVFMITSAGAEGIDLKGVKHVHIMEPYWNPVRTEQVIGRARRICSHASLPKEDQIVNVHYYISIHESIQPSTDEFLYNLSLEKSTLTKSILDQVIEASIDAPPFPIPKSSFSFHPNIMLNSNLMDDVVHEKNVHLIKIQGSQTLNAIYHKKKSDPWPPFVKLFVNQKHVAFVSCKVNAQGKQIYLFYDLNKKRIPTQLLVFEYIQTKLKSFGTI